MWWIHTINTDAGNITGIITPTNTAGGENASILGHAPPLLAAPEPTAKLFRLFSQQRSARRSKISTTRRHDAVPYFSRSFPWDLDEKQAINTGER